MNKKLVLIHAYVNWLADPDCYRDRQYIPAVLLPHSLCRKAKGMYSKNYFQH